MYERFLWYDIDTDFAFFAFKKEFDHFCAHLNAKKPNVTSRSQLFEKKVSSYEIWIPVDFTR